MPSDEHYRLVDRRGDRGLPADIGVLLGQRQQAHLQNHIGVGFLDLPQCVPRLGDLALALVGQKQHVQHIRVGAGGLGEFIFRGLAMVDNRVILAGAIPAAVLALLADFGVGWIEKRLRPR